jgi:hypothetical protein
LIGAFFLNRLDAALEKLDLFYVRFIGRYPGSRTHALEASERSEGRQSGLGMFRFGQNPEKTFIGRVERGFDFLGYHFSRAGLSAAKQTVINFIERASRLYEQGRCTPLGVSPLEMYAKRWLCWLHAGVGAIMRLRRQPDDWWLFFIVCATKPAVQYPPLLAGQDAVVGIRGRELRHCDTIARPPLHALEDEVDAVSVPSHHLA